MRIAVLCDNEPAQAYFIRRLAAEHDVAGIVVDQRYDAADRLRRLWRASGKSLPRLLGNVARKARLVADERSEWKVRRQYFPDGTRPSELALAEIHLSRNINTTATLAFIRGKKPELLAVFGTRLLKESLIRAAPRGALNLHTGLSPYYRGGHSTFFCLYNNEPQYIGATVHNSDPGIDSGGLLRTARPAIEAGDGLASLECKVALLGIELMATALREVGAGTAQSVPQWTEGRLYYSRDYTLARRLELRRRLAEGLLREYLARPQRRDDVRLVP